MDLGLTCKAYGSKNSIQEEEILDIGHPVYWAKITWSPDLPLDNHLSGSLANQL